VSVRLRLDGMNELRAQLRRLPEELRSDASHIVEATANGVAADVRRRYPQGETGNLIRGVAVTRVDAGKVAAGAIVKSASKHAHLFERGTNTRRTGKGANRGRMPEASESQQMIPVVIRARRRMYEQLADLLRRAGFQVGE
jgi:hypothetical protein